MIYSRYNIEVLNTEYRDKRTYRLDAGVQAQKLTIQVLSLDALEEEAYGPVIVQVTEDPYQTFEDELKTSQWLEVGFNSRGFATPITAFRVRAPTEQEILEGKRKLPALPGFIHFTFYG